MIIREFRESDIPELKKIHEKFYKDEFNFPDFFDHFLCSFTLLNEEGKIVAGGGVRLITESVLITNKDLSVEERREALYKVLDASAFICVRDGFNQLHAFIQESNWERHLRKVGFTDCKGKALFMNF